MMWPFKKQGDHAEMIAAKAAKIEAQLDLDIAKQKYQEVSEQTDQLRLINKRNHFSESLTRAFREAPL